MFIICLLSNNHYLSLAISGGVWEVSPDKTKAREYAMNSTNGRFILIGSSAWEVLPSEFWPIRHSEIENRWLVDVGIHMLAITEDDLEAFNIYNS